jgi:putative N6-adenine-specific DNA methylase
MKALKKFEKGTDFTAKTFAGLETVLAEELKNLGADGVEPGNRVVYFRGDRTLLYKANFLCRTALRILQPVGVFTVHNENELYEKIKRVDWPALFDVKKKIIVSASVFHSSLTHSHYVALKTKDAIVDLFREKTGKRPFVSKENPDIYIDVHISQDKCTVSLDSSGESLHKRGYRTAADKAPLNEVLAAGMIRLSGWNKTGDFIDPMCGSGTIPIEAAMEAMRIPAGYYRRQYAFQHWKAYDAELWEKTKEEANAAITEHNFPIIASDKSYKAFKTAKSNLKQAGLHKDIMLLNKPFEKVNPETGKGILMFNPPYGVRLEEQDLTALYRHIGDVLKNRFQGYEAWIITGNPAAAKFIGLKSSKKIILFNGPIESRFIKFEMYGGSKKAKKNPKTS